MNVDEIRDWLDRLPPIDTSPIYLVDEAELEALRAAIPAGETRDSTAVLTGRPLVIDPARARAQRIVWAFDRMTPEERRAAGEAMLDRIRPTAEFMGASLIGLSMSVFQHDGAPEPRRSITDIAL